MEDEKDAFYVVRKGDIVGVYKSFSDFQPLVSPVFFWFSRLYAISI